MDNLKTEKRKDIFLMLLIIGSIWGFSEVIMNAFVRAAGIPLRASILTGIGMFLLGVGYFLIKKPIILPLIAFVAILIKQMAVPILGVGLSCKANSCIAVFIEGSALAALVYVMSRNIHKSNVAKSFAGFGSGFTASVGFYFIGLHAFPCDYLSSFASASGFVSYLVNEALMWGVFSAVLFPLGYRLGTKIEKAMITLQQEKPIFYHYIATSIITLCWISSAVVIALGY